MAGEPTVGSRAARTAQAARAAGIRGHEPTLSHVNKRRTELWSTSLVLVVAVAGALALVLLRDDLIPGRLRSLDGSASWIGLVLVVGLVFAFLGYVIEKERSLRRLTSSLMEERVLSVALSNRLAEISALSDVGKAINTTLDLEDVLNMILSSSLELLGGKEGSVMLLTSDGAHLDLVTYRGRVEEALLPSRTPVGEGIAGTVAQRRKPMLIDGSDVEADLADKAHPERGIRSSMCVPLIRGDELIGVLNLNETEGKRRFTQDDLQALDLFAQHAAIAIGNAALFKQERATIQKLEELDRLKSDFVATVSHELKTPLTAIIGSATTLSRRSNRLTPQQRTTMIDVIERQGQRLLRLVQDILTAAQIESGMPRLRRELVDLTDAAQMIIDDLKHAHPDRTVSLDAVPERPHVWGDLGAIQQILSNLIENALKYSDEGDVHVQLEEKSNETVLHVSDQGRGMSAEQLAIVFDRFRQVDQSDTRGEGGVGLGLYIVKSLVEAHNGDVKVESEEGRGTTFTVFFPKRSGDRDKPLLAAEGPSAPPAISD